MKLIVGLGNPGEEYVLTRHNVGFILLDYLAEENKSEWQLNKYVQSMVVKTESQILAKPNTYMNKSGDAVSLLLKHYEVSPQDLIVIHDDLDIKLGEYKFQLGKGPKVHNGVSSIEQSLTTDQFWRIRVGIDNRDPENRFPGEGYVLQKFTLLEKEILDNTIRKICQEILQK